MITFHVISLLCIAKCDDLVLSCLNLFNKLDLVLTTFHVISLLCIAKCDYLFLCYLNLFNKLDLVTITFHIFLMARTCGTCMFFFKNQVCMLKNIESRRLIGKFFYKGIFQKIISKQTVIKFLYLISFSSWF